MVSNQACLGVLRPVSPHPGLFEEPERNNKCDDDRSEDDQYKDFATPISTSLFIFHQTGWPSNIFKRITVRCPRDHGVVGVSGQRSIGRALATVIDTAGSPREGNLPERSSTVSLGATNSKEGCRHRAMDSRGCIKAIYVSAGGSIGHVPLNISK